jgi:hypothetical protein
MAALFFWHGQFMAFSPADMVVMINENIGEGLRVFIGVAEILAAIGLILPGLTRILPWLTALAAAGLMIIMSSATVLHFYRGETASGFSRFSSLPHAAERQSSRRHGPQSCCIAVSFGLRSAHPDTYAQAQWNERSVA